MEDSNTIKLGENEIGREAYFESLGKNGEKLAEVCEILNDGNVWAVAKGSSIENIFGYNDVDILVRGEDVEKYFDVVRDLRGVIHEERNNDIETKELVKLHGGLFKVLFKKENRHNFGKKLEEVQNRKAWNNYEGVRVPLEGYAGVYADLRTKMKYKNLKLDLVFSETGYDHFLENQSPSYVTLSTNEGDMKFVEEAREKHEWSSVQKIRGEIEIPSDLK